MEPLFASFAKVLGYLAAPIFGLLAFLAKRLHNRIDDLEKENRKSEIDIALVKQQLMYIQKDLNGLGAKLDGIKDCLEKKDA